MNELTQLSVELKQIKEKLDVIVVAIVGDPSDPSKPGVLLRLDRLEQSNIQKTKIFWLMASGIAAALGSVAFQWFK
jgi:hypothetical protein